MRFESEGKPDHMAANAREAFWLQKGFVVLLYSNIWFVHLPLEKRKQEGRLGKATLCCPPVDGAHAIPWAFHPLLSYANPLVAAAAITMQLMSRIAGCLLTPHLHMCIPSTFCPFCGFAQDAIITRMIDGRLALDLHKMLWPKKKKKKGILLPSGIGHRD